VKKSLMLAILLLMAGLAGCSSSPDYKIDFTKPLYFLQDKAAPFEIKVTENNKAVTGLKVKAAFTMANMDHGTYNATLTEGQNGTYSGKVKLPMTGKYEADITFEKGGKKTEQTVDLTLKKPAGVALINGKWITNDDIDFYKFINYLQLAINREAAHKQFSGKKLDEELAYLKSQEKMAEDKNQILTQIIRLRAMGLIAKEKGYTATDEEVTKELTKAREQYKPYNSA
jgi:YtkA-like